VLVFYGFIFCIPTDLIVPALDFQANVFMLPYFPQFTDALAFGVDTPYLQIIISPQQSLTHDRSYFTVTSVGALGNWVL